MLQIVMKYYYHNSIVEIPSQDHITCQENMWRNMLFIDTFFPIQERVKFDYFFKESVLYVLYSIYVFQCMPWSWFFSLDCQFFVAASIILLIANNHPRYATVICMAFFVSSFVTTTIIRYNKRPKTSLAYEDQIAEFNSVYDQPWIRIAPFLLGMCLGYILFKTNETIRLNIFVIVTGKSKDQNGSIHFFDLTKRGITILSQSLGWIATILLLCGISFRNLFLMKSNLWMEASLSSISHTVWPMILFWIILSSVSQHQGNKKRKRLGKLNYVELNS